jgi:hypothetical protein
MAAPVVGDHSETLAEEEYHLRVPIIGRQRPAVAKHDGLTLAPVLIEDFRAVLRLDCTHFCFFDFNLFGRDSCRRQGYALPGRSCAKRRKSRIHSRTRRQSRQCSTHERVARFP